MLPRGLEASQRAGVDRLDLLAKHRQRRATQAAEHLGIAPLALGPTRPQLAAHEGPISLELAQRRRAVDPVTGAQVVDRERAMARAVASDQP